MTKPNGQAATPHRLPDDPNAVILRWDSGGGLRATSASAEPGEQAALLLHASGEFSARPAHGSTARRTGRLTPAALQALLTELIDHHGFSSISAEDIQAQMADIVRRTGRVYSVMDGGVTRISLQLPAVQHSVEMAALHAAQARFPEIGGLQRLLAVQQRLLALAISAV